MRTLNSPLTVGIRGSSLRTVKVPVEVTYACVAKPYEVSLRAQEGL
jgi:hypothetical protein